ncbi:FxsA family protein [Novispirillum sp. DQ9]|uniref:FxsA family protein n=1 Tax=Novispirillum sp. DQ9 TaxID=3398612 RepID=UPI003C7DAFFA
MRLVILILFIAVPLLEIAVFIQVGGVIGPWPTIALVLLTAVAGTMLLRSQGLATLRRAQASLDRGEMPLREVADGMCLLFAGVLLLVPGFVTDILGLLLFLPPVRNGLLGRLSQAVKTGKVHVQGLGGGFGGFGGPAGTAPHGPPTDIEGEYRDITPPDEPPREPRRLDRD